MSLSLKYFLAATLLLLLSMKTAISPLFPSIYWLFRGVDKRNLYALSAGWLTSLLWYFIFVVATVYYFRFLQKKKRIYALCFLAVSLLASMLAYFYLSVLSFTPGPQVEVDIVNVLFDLFVWWFILNTIVFFTKTFQRNNTIV